MDNPKPNTEDFYWEEGKVVMTERYHLKRGSCCGSGCRHCPFSPPHIKMNEVLQIKTIDIYNKEL